MSSSSDETFVSRLQSILEGIHSIGGTIWSNSFRLFYESRVKQLGSYGFARHLSSFVRSDIRDAFSRDTPPTTEDFTTIGLADTNDFAVYVVIVKAKSDEIELLEFYTGSATDTFYGFHRRRQTYLDYHSSPSHIANLPSRIRKHLHEGDNFELLGPFPIAQFSRNSSLIGEHAVLAKFLESVIMIFLRTLTAVHLQKLQLSPFAATDCPFSRINWDLSLHEWPRIADIPGENPSSKRLNELRGVASKKMRVELRENSKNETAAKRAAKRAADILVGIRLKEMREMRKMQLEARKEEQKEYTIQRRETTRVADILVSIRQKEGEKEKTRRREAKEMKKHNERILGLIGSLRGDFPLQTHDVERFLAQL